MRSRPPRRHSASRALRVADFAWRQRASTSANVHVHALVLDGVYVEDEPGTLRFQEATPPTKEELDRLLATINRRLQRLLARRGVVDDVGAGD